VYQIVSRFQTKDGLLRALSYRHYQLGPSTIVFAALVIAAAFGCIHFSISRIDPGVLVLLFGVNLVMSMWIQKVTPGKLADLATRVESSKPAFGSHS